MLLNLPEKMMMLLNLNRLNVIVGYSSKFIYVLFLSANKNFIMNKLFNLETVNDVSYKIKVANFNELSPLQLGAKYIDDLIKVDSMIPSDLYGDDKINKVNESILDNYSFDGKDSKYESLDLIMLPDKYFEEFNSSELIAKSGVLADINRAWFIVDNKLILWNYRAPQSSFNNNTTFVNIDLRHTILSVKLVKPKPGVFVKEINYVLIIATTMHIHIYVIKYDEKLNNLEIFNPNMSVLCQGLIVNNIITNPKNNDIFFSEGINVWRLDYTNKLSFIRNKCDKVCLTKSGFMNKISIFHDDQQSQIPESIIQLDIDDDRNVLYSLSNKSIIRTYKIADNQEYFTSFNKITPSEIFKNVSALFVDSNNFKSFAKFRIINIQAITKESSNVQLIAITNFGVRILLKLGISSFYLASQNSLKLSVVTLKFPPSKDIPVVSNDLDSFAQSKQYINQLISNQQKSQLLQNAKIAKIISPGVFLVVKKSTKGDKVFVSTVNYGFLKKNNKIIEDAEFLKLSGGHDELIVHDIIQLTPSMNATNQPKGYANILASQYTKKPLQFAVITNFGIQIFQYKTPDKILKNLRDDVIESFIETNGYEETCSTLLYLSCSTIDFSNRKAIVLFSSLGNSARLGEESQQPLSQISLVGGNSSEKKTQVILSDRFYGTCLLISRLFKEYWNSKVFTQKDEVIVINMTKGKIEYFIGSVMILLDFFNTYGNNILGLNAPTYSADPSRVDNEICLRSEHIGFTSIIKCLNSMKEALSFLMVLIEETSFSDIFKFLPDTNKRSLLELTFRSLLLPNEEVKTVIKDLLSSTINKNILKGGSIDYITNSLQEKCGSFVSTDDVLIFRAIENLTRAQKIGNRDLELQSKCLKNAVVLFEQSFKSLTLENIQNCVNIMLELDYFTGAIALLLKLVTNPKVDTIIKDKLYNLVFDIVDKIDIKVLNIKQTTDDILKINEMIESRKLVYDNCFNCKDKMFHYRFYQWFVDQGRSDKLLDLNTQFILEFLQEKSNDNIKLNDILWMYYAKRERYYEAANVLYSLSVSEFKLDLSKRLEYLSRSNGFCNCTIEASTRQKVIQLSTLIQDLFDVGNVQLDILTTISNDTRINKDTKAKSIEGLNNQILNVTDLFNDYVDPLGYYDLALVIFKMSDYRNSDDIYRRWELFFEKLYYQRTDTIPLHIHMLNEFPSVGQKLANNDLVFPIDKLIKLIAKYLNDAFEQDPLQLAPLGIIIDLFIKSGVSYEKLYYIIKNIIRDDSFEVYDGFITFLNDEMVYLIKSWYSNDKNLRSRVNNDEILKMKVYKVNNDPIIAA